jgi:sugar (pentulose or hexulose) kinase
MENRVGDNLPTEQQLAAWKAALDTLFAEMKPFMTKLSKDEKQHLLQFRPGGEKIVALIATLAEKYGIHLADMPVAGMRSDLQLSQVLAPVVGQLALMASWGDDTLAAARSEAWQATTGNYSVLSRVAESNASLAEELKPAKQFFARRKKGPEEGGGSGGSGGGG